MNAEDNIQDELARLGRPSLSGSSSRGPSPKRQVRLPIALDRALSQRVEVEQRNASEILRDALDAYLHQAS